ncbi:MAG: hypothetical protein JW816_02370 [Candidatus Buchananbacteria bacterium]|nr:hypothetical protein [Candidatus Buchananbacteria bacterium]
MTQNLDNKKDEIAKNGEIIPFNNAKSLSKFLDKPTIKIAEAITGALSLGRPEMLTIGGRLVQGVIKGKLMQQLGREMKQLIEKGKIREDYAKTKYGFKSLADILEFIDSEAPDEDRFRAVKALFFATISKDVNDIKQIANDRLLQIVKKLTSSEILTMKINYEIFLDREGRKLITPSADSWPTAIASKIGHNLKYLVELDEKALVDNKIIHERRYPDQSGINDSNARLTDLGIKICKTIENYQDFYNTND